MNISRKFDFVSFKIRKKTNNIKVLHTLSLKIFYVKIMRKIRNFCNFHKGDVFKNAVLKKKQTLFYEDFHDENCDAAA